MLNANLLTNSRQTLYTNTLSTISPHRQYNQLCHSPSSSYSHCQQSHHIDSTVNQQCHLPPSCYSHLSARPAYREQTISNTKSILRTTHTLTVITYLQRVIFLQNTCTQTRKDFHLLLLFLNSLLRPDLMGRG